MGMTATSGTSYHCANFNNLFFQVRGRKKWTFVPPQYTPLMYPMLNAKAMDVASFLTTVALKSPADMEAHFPLYKASSPPPPLPSADSRLSVRPEDGGNSGAWRCAHEPPGEPLPFPPLTVASGSGT
jgi:hypothetical protein